MGLIDKLWKNPEGDDTTKKEPIKQTVPHVKPAVNTSIPGINSIALAGAQNVPGIQNVNTISVPTNQDGSIDPEIIEYFKKVYADANLPGPDFNEFSNALDNMKMLQVDDMNKYLMAFATLSVQGCTKQKLIDSANTYLSKFAEKHAGFNKAIDAQMNEAVGGRQTTINGLVKKNEEIDLEIARLNNLKNDNAMEVQKLFTELTEESAKLSSKKLNFDKTYNYMVAEIHTALEKIKQFINQ